MMTTQQHIIKKRIICVEDRIEELNVQMNKLKENLENCVNKKRKYQSELEKIKIQNNIDKKILISIEYTSPRKKVQVENFEYIGKIPEIFETCDIAYTYNEYNTIYNAESTLENCDINCEENLTEIKKIVDLDKFKTNLLSMRYKGKKLDGRKIQYLKKNNYDGRVQFVISLKYDIYYHNQKIFYQIKVLNFIHSACNSYQFNQQFLIMELFIVLFFYYYF